MATYSHWNKIVVDIVLVYLWTFLLGTFHVLNASLSICSAVTKDIDA